MKRILSIVLSCIYFLVAVTNISAFARTDFQPSWPLRNGFNISALDAYQSGGAHRGIDVGHGNQPTQNVYPVASGVVTSVGNKCSHHNDYPHGQRVCAADSLGNFVTIMHNYNGKVFYSQYAHLTKDSIRVSVNDTVDTNTVIGKMGSSGNSTGPHLHFSIWEDGCYADREATFDFYKDNVNLMRTLRIRQKLANVSKLYGGWIKSNGTLKSDGLYYFENMKGSSSGNGSSDNVINKDNSSNNNKPKKEPSSVKISPNSYPGGTLKYGEDFILTAKFTSDCAIVEARAYMLDNNKNVIMEAKGSSTTGNYYVEGYALDKGMKFDQLEPGAYYLKYYVKDANGDTATWTSAKFYVEKENIAPAPDNSSKSPSYTQTIADGVYVVSSKLNSDYVLDISGSSKNDGANLQLWQSNGTGAQTFKVTYLGNGYYQIVNTNSGKAIDAENGGTAAGTNVWQYQVNNTDAQIWAIVNAGGGYYHIVCKNSGLYLDVNNGNVASGENIKLWTNNGHDAQKWSFKKATSGNTSSLPSNTNTSTPQPAAPTTSIRFELEAVPGGNMPYGKSFTLKGWFRSDCPIVEARAYMLDANKNVVMQSDAASSTTSNYKIQGYKLDKAMKFNELSPGGYYLKYFVRDANGDTATWISDMFYIVK